MKLGGVLIPASVVCAAGVTAIEAPAYTFGQNVKLSPDNTPLTVSAEGARLLFASKLGLSQYYDLQNADDSTLALLNRIGSAQYPLFASDGDSKEVEKLMIIVEGVEKPEDLLGLSHLPAFTIVNPPSPSANTQLAIELIEQGNRHRRSAAGCPDHVEVRSAYVSESIRGDYSADDAVGTCVLEEPTAASQNYAIRTEQDLELIRLPGHGTKIFQVLALEMIASLEGKHSKSYSRTLAKLKTILTDLGHEPGPRETVVVLMPPPPILTKRDDDAYGSYEVQRNSVQARGTQKERPLVGERPKGPMASPNSGVRLQASNNSTAIRTTIPICHPSEALCKSTTNDCSGHGSCFRKFTNHVADGGPSECWACACNATNLGSTHGNKTIAWGGAACQKRDVSSPFWLLAGFSIFMVVAVAWGVGMLYSIGEEGLPSVIGAGVAGPRAAK